MECLLCASTMSGTVGTAVNETHSRPAWSWPLTARERRVGGHKSTGSWESASAAESKDSRRLTVPLGVQAAALGFPGAEHLQTKAEHSLIRQFKAMRQCFLFSFLARTPCSRDDGVLGSEGSAGANTEGAFQLERRCAGEWRWP